MVDALKSYLKITYSEEDDYLVKLIKRGKDYLNNITGIELDFDIESSAKSLLLDYCRYVYNNALEYFEENFKSQLLRLQIESAVSKNEKPE